ncbi:hypothetical protein ACOTHJ_32800 [Achromobacter xylosoxidans]
MGIKTFTVKTCDRCEREIDDGAKHSEWGEAQLSWRGHTAGRAWNGDVGGANFEGNALLCLPCARLFQQFMTPFSARPAAQAQQQGEG